MELDHAAASGAGIFHAKRGIFAKQDEGGSAGPVPCTGGKDEGGAGAIDGLTDSARLVLRGAESFERNGEPRADGTFLRFLREQVGRQFRGIVIAGSRQEVFLV